LEDIKFTKNGNLKKGTNTYYEKAACIVCGESYLILNKYETKFCSNMCAQAGENNPNYGKHRTENTKKLISDSNKRVQRNWKNGFPRLGKAHSSETRIKISISNKGKLLGSKNHFWKGGVSCEPYCSIWKDREYKESIKFRDGNKCLNPCCNNKSIKLNIHHINYNKKDCSPKNLVTLCNSCNSIANKDRIWHTAWYQAILKNRYNL
jgi:hypothetical protein